MNHRRLQTLDALRGVAALCVVATHASALFGHKTAPSAYLAVDVFFLLSGFVIAHAYDGRGLTIREFSMIRLVRLYPLYAMGLVLGVAQFALLVVLGRSEWSPLRWVGLALNAAYLPSPGGARGGALFPFDPPAWSLFFEVAINVVFASMIFRSRGRIALLMLVSATGLAVFVSQVGSIGGGFNWTTIFGGAARVGWAFPAGVLIRRYAPRVAIPPWASLALLVTAVAALWIDPGPLRPFYDLGFVALAPVVVWLCANAPLYPIADRVLRPLGVASYALYATHFPLLPVGALMGRLLHLGPLATGSLYMAMVVAVAVFLERFYDRPVRAWLGRLLLPVKPGAPSRATFSDRTPASLSSP